ncbi:MAG: hypothetical protein LBQ15_06570 [Clostridium sp.]|nr:hypothetical protein [Clostridium sp.]
MFEAVKKPKLTDKIIIVSCEKLTYETVFLLAVTFMAAGLLNVPNVKKNRRNENEGTEGAEYLVTHP